MGAILSILAIFWIGYALFSKEDWAYGLDSDLGFYISRYLYPWHVAIVMGYFYCAEPNGSWKHHKDSFFIGLALSIAFMFIFQVIKKKKLILFIRDVITEFSIIFVGYGIALLIDFLTSTIFKGLLSLLFIPVNLVAGIMLAALPISLVIWFIPNSVLAVMNRKSKNDEEKHSTNDSNHSNEGLSFNNVQSMPNIITGPYGQNYRLINMGVYSADYQGVEDSSIVTIYNKDINPSGMSATNSYGYFYW